MKRVIISLILTIFSPALFAGTAANIQINITGVAKNNYYLCMPDLGCLSIYAARVKGKVFPILRSVEMNTLFVTDLNTGRVYNQGLPESCQVTVKTGQTIKISGALLKSKDTIKVKNLQCKVIK